MIEKTEKEIYVRLFLGVYTVYIKYDWENIYIDSQALKILQKG